MLLPETKGKPIEDNIKAIIPNLEEKSESNFIYLFHVFRYFKEFHQKQQKEEAKNSENA